MQTRSKPLIRTVAIFIGVAVPALVLGRAALGVFLVLAFILAAANVRGPALLDAVRRQSRTPIGVLILATYFLWFTNIFVSLDPWRSITASSRTVLLIAFAVVFCEVLARDRRCLEICLRALVAGTLTAVSFALISMLLVPELFWVLKFKGWRPDPIDLHVRTFGALAVVLVPAVIWAGGRLGRIWFGQAVLSAFGFIALNLLIYNKAPLAGLLAILAVTAIAVLTRPDTRRWGLPAVIVFGIATAAVLFWIFKTRGWADDLWPDDKWLLPLWLLDFQRNFIWEHTWNLFLKSPWFGYGINTINLTPGADAIIPTSLGYPIIPGHPHNWLLEVLSETGVVGFVPFVAAIMASVWNCYTRFRRDGDLAMLAALAIAAGYWSSGLFNFSYWSAWWQMSFFVLTAICLAGAPREEDHL